MQLGNYKIEDNTCIKVYDPITKTLIAVFQDYKEASRKLGIDRKMICSGYALKKQRFSPILNKKVAIRLGNKNSIKNDTTVKSNN